MSRASETLAGIPTANLSAMVLCVAVFLYQTVADPPLQHYTLCPRNVVFLNEYYRLVTSCLFHGGLMHIGFNMMSTAAIGSLLEKRFGTLRHAVTILWGILLTSAVYTIVALLLYLTIGVDTLMYQHSVGFSGVLFQLSVLEANLSPNATRSVFGLARVPAYMYPWALLVALQVFMPQISFMGHLAGILVGTLQLYGVLDVLIMPSDDYLRTLEDLPALRFLTGRSNFVKTPAEGSNVVHARDPAALGGAVRRGVGMVWKFVKDLAVTVRVAIFGYGRGNENIQLGGGEQAVLVGDELNVDDDDDWVGLPPAPAPSEVESRMV